MRVVYTLEARQDLAEIRAYIATANQDAALRVMSRIRATIENLASFPNIGRPGSVKSTRELRVKSLPYIVVYEVTRTRIVILDIFHGARER